MFVYDYFNQFSFYILYSPAQTVGIYAMHWQNAIFTGSTFAIVNVAQLDFVKTCSLTMFSHSWHIAHTTPAYRAKLLAWQLVRAIRMSYVSDNLIYFACGMCVWNVNCLEFYKWFRSLTYTYTKHWKWSSFLCFLLLFIFRWRVALYAYSIIYLQWLKYIYIIILISVVSFFLISRLIFPLQFDVNSV